MAFTPRLTAPADFGTYYTERRLNPCDGNGTETFWQYFYSGHGGTTDHYLNPNYPNAPHTGNCTWYAMGRSAEIAGRNLYSEFAGSYEAQNWNSIWTGNPAQTSGTINWQPGDILVYSNAGQTAGHVEIVEEAGGTRLTISYSAYSGTNPQSDYGTFFGTRKRLKTMTFGDPASDTTDTESYFTRNSGATYYMTNEYLVGVIHNPYYDPGPDPGTNIYIYINHLRRRRRGRIRYV